MLPVVGVYDQMQAKLQLNILCHFFLSDIFLILGSCGLFWFLSDFVSVVSPLMHDPSAPGPLQNQMP